MGKESKYGCQPCHQAVEIIRQAYQNTTNKSQQQAMERVNQTIDEVRNKIGCTECPLIGMEKINPTC